MGVMSAYYPVVVMFNGPRGSLFGIWRTCDCGIRTEVVLSPQSKAGVTDERAGGVSIHSKFSSITELLILSMVW